MALIGGLIAVIVVLLIVVVFFVTRSPDPVKEGGTSPANTTTNGGLSTVTPVKTSLPTSAPAPTRPMVTNTKYRLLLKDGKEPYCVTSKLKKAYPVRTNEEGIRVCVGTPEGPIPVDSLKPYQVSEMQWE